MKKKIVTFGEIMLRLTTPDNLRMQQSREFLVNYGGSEANVAISIANFGGDVEYITRLPDNALGETCLAELRSHNIGTQHILTGGHVWELITWKRQPPCVTQKLFTTVRDLLSPN